MWSARDDKRPQLWEGSLYERLQVTTIIKRYRLHWLWLSFFWDTKPRHWVGGSRHFEVTSTKAPWTVTSDTPLPKSSKLAHFGCFQVVCITKLFENRGKGKIHFRTGHECLQGEKQCSSTLYLSSALDGGEWSTSRPGRFTPGKETRYPLYMRLGGTQGGSGWVLKISPPPGFDPPDRSDIPTTQSRPTNTEVPSSKYHLL
jgi:hypothetical protein